ncbi:hypothetical protein BPORC_1740 [Bifidobacterium porcinum]|nr:hypothetical protein BPORC_1740 [Bifidobacterium porcinum]
MPCARALVYHARTHKRPAHRGRTDVGGGRQHGSACRRLRDKTTPGAGGDMHGVRCRKRKVNE